MHVMDTVSLLRFKLIGALSSSQRKWYIGVSVAVLLALSTGVYLVEVASSMALTGHFMYREDTTHPEANAVIEVTKGHLEQTSTKNRVVEFYSPYCGHCVSFKHTYMTVAHEAKSRRLRPPLQFYAVSCAGRPELCERYQIQHYPSLYVVPAGSSNVTQHEIDTYTFSLTEIERVLNRTTVPK